MLVYPLFFPCYLVVSSIYLSGGLKKQNTDTHTTHIYTYTLATPSNNSNEYWIRKTKRSFQL